ncbi:MAG: HEAT repeat domain-containing protein [Thermodesulfovibrionales bacterium]|nr:HEAT repeat domain-containing protein [Thermodesulfovibrionales bacterium]
MAELKDKITALLKQSDFDGLILTAGKDRAVLRHLISLTYDRGDVLCRRAVEAIGMVTAAMPHEEARKAAQRVLWMMRDESGGSAWSGPDILGEIVRGNPEPMLDIVPIIASFHEEDIFRPGVLKALGRIAEVRPEMVRPLREMIEAYASHDDPLVRGNAVYALGTLGLKEDFPV